MLSAPVSGAACQTVRATPAVSVDASAGVTLPLPSASNRTMTPCCGVPLGLETLTASVPNEPGVTTESGAASAARLGLVNCGITMSSRIAMMTKMATVSRIENPRRAALLTHDLLCTDTHHAGCMVGAYYKHRSSRQLICLSADVV